MSAIGAAREPFDMPIEPVHCMASRHNIGRWLDRIERAGSLTSSQMICNGDRANRLTGSTGCDTRLFYRSVVTA